MFGIRKRLRFNKEQLTAHKKLISSLQLAPFGKRLVAAIIDFWSIVGLILLATEFVYYIYNNNPTESLKITLIVLTNGWLCIGVELLYIIMTRSNTLGKRMFGLNVVTVDGKEPDLKTAILRSLALPLGVMLYPKILFDEHHQALHDKIAGTLVVMKNRSLNGINQADKEETKKTRHHWYVYLVYVVGFYLVIQMGSAGTRLRPLDNRAVEYASLFVAAASIYYFFWVRKYISRNLSLLFKGSLYEIFGFTGTMSKIAFLSLTPSSLGLVLFGFGGSKLSFFFLQLISVLILLYFLVSYIRMNKKT